MATGGCRVTVHGDLSPEVLERIGDSVRRAVLSEVAELDLAPPPGEGAARRRGLSPRRS